MPFFSIALVALTLLPSGGSGALPSASPSPSMPPNLVPASCAPAAPAPSGLIDTFGYDLEAPELLQLVDAIAAVPALQREALYDRVAAAGSSQTERRVESALAAACPDADAVDATARVRYIVALGWHVDGVKSGAQFGAFTSATGVAMSALSATSTLPAELRIAALLPFAALLANVPKPSPTPHGACADDAIRILAISEPGYPQVARDAQTTGAVEIKLSIGDTGAIRWARVEHQTVGQGPGASALLDASLYAAVTTTYRPQTLNCIPVPGFYSFDAKYNQR